MKNKSEILSELRDLKIKIITSDIQLNINKSCILKLSNELDFISKNLSDSIITGSTALRIYGLINRDINDIDIFIKDPDRYVFNDDSRYGESNTLFSNRLGYRNFKSWRWNILKPRVNYEVDFFLNKGDINYNVIDYKGVKLKVHNPIDIISKKFEIVSANNLRSIRADEKHYSDIIFILNLISLIEASRR